MKTFEKCNWQCRIKFLTISKPVKCFREQKQWSSLSFVPETFPKFTKFRCDDELNYTELNWMQTGISETYGESWYYFMVFQIQMEISFQEIYLIIPSNYLKAVFHKFYLVHSGIVCP